MYGSLDISASGMIAQRTRLAAISANIANSGTILDADGNLNPFKRRLVHFAPGNPASGTREGRGMGVHVREIEADQNAVRKRFMPGHPYADDKGYVPWPDINPVREQIDALEVSRAYEANVMAAETTKSMMAQAIRLLG